MGDYVTGERVLGLDYGSRRIGVAVSDPLGLTVQPLPPIRREGDKKDIVALARLAAKNAILIVEFAKTKRENGKDLVEAALQGAQIRLRPILMTSFAFILGCVPLWIAQGAGAASRRILGTVVVAGMLAATCLAIFLIPVLFVVVERRLGSMRGKEARP